MLCFYELFYVDRNTLMSNLQERYVCLSITVDYTKCLVSRCIYLSTKMVSTVRAPNINNELMAIMQLITGITIPTRCT